MRIGYPCVNNSIGCTSSSTFRLANYSEERLFEKIESNLACLQRILQWNRKNELMFFRISSDIIPFASHPINSGDWKDRFRKQLLEIGGQMQDMRISLHPDQFVLLNAIDDDIVNKSIMDLQWHSEFLDELGLDDSAKVQIHIGGVYGDKDAAVERFISAYQQLPPLIRKRLVVENDDRLYSLQDCRMVHRRTGIPVVFDSLHHSSNNNGESMKAAVQQASRTWGGPMMADYSSQAMGGRPGKHAEHIDLKDFKKFLKAAEGIDMDIMLEVKDKEMSALEAKKELWP